jgi:hypothetical protein
MATKGNEENIKELKEEFEKDGLKTLDLSDGAEAPAEEDINFVAKHMCDTMNFYPKFCEEVARLIKPFIKVDEHGKKTLEYMEDAFLKCLKELPVFVDKNLPVYQKILEGKFTLPQQNIIYTYIGNSYLSILTARSFSDVLISNGISPVFKCSKVKVKGAAEVYNDLSAKEAERNSPKGVVN